MCTFVWLLGKNRSTISIRHASRRVGRLKCRWARLKRRLTCTILGAKKTDTDWSYLHSSHWRSSRNWNIAIQMDALAAGMIGLHSVQILWTFIQQLRRQRGLFAYLYRAKNGLPAFIRRTGIPKRTGILHFRFQQLNHFSTSCKMGHIRFSDPQVFKQRMCTACVDNFATVSSGTFARGRGC